MNEKEFDKCTQLHVTPQTIKVLGREVQEKGLTKRELFAAMAMQGILANSAVDCCAMDEAHVAVVSKRHADALIAALEAQGNDK